MSEAETLFAALRASTGDDAVAMLERLVRDAPDRALIKINALDLAAKEGIGEERVIAALLNAVGLGIFEMSWNVMCPSCGGVLSANKSLKTLDRAQYNCAFCAAGYETTLDKLVEVTFTVSPRVRRIAAHSPDELPAAEYYRQIFGARRSTFRPTWRRCSARSRSKASTCRPENGRSSRCDCRKAW